MADRELKKWQLALIAGIILIVPVIIAFQLTKADININDLNPTFVSGCNMEGTVCTYNMDNTVRVITISEDEEKWTLMGNCIDTALASFLRSGAVIQRDSGQTLSDPVFGFNPEECRDLVIFLKDDWDRENTFVNNSEVNIFTLRDVAQDQDVSNFIEQNYGG